MKVSTALVGIASLGLVTVARPTLAFDPTSIGDGPQKSAAGPMGQMGAHMSMGAHMVMTTSRPATAEDLEKAKDIADTLRRSIRKYKDYRVALAAGFVQFLPSVPQEVYHFTSYSDTANEYAGHFDATRPGSVLYVKKGPDDYRLVGAMYDAPPDSTPDELNALIPLSVGTWHAHTNICLPEGITLGDLMRGNFGGDHMMPGMIPIDQNPRAVELNRQYGIFADGRFGFTGSIADQAECESAGGHFIKQAFGWMIHVYPFAGDDLKVAYSTDVPDPDRAPAR
jgi:hypothetical protein